MSIELSGEGRPQVLQLSEPLEIEITIDIRGPMFGRPKTVRINGVEVLVRNVTVKDSLAAKIEG